MIKPTIQRTPSGAILFDASLMESADIAWFEPGSADPAEVAHGGRGQALYFDAPFGACVLRHYRRGGLIGRVNHDRYLFTGRKRTRAFREFNLLARLHGMGLPVPAPVMARYVRKGLCYRADLITRRIAGAESLAERVGRHALDSALAAQVGRTLAEFHARGLWHADLNAGNLLVDRSGKVWLIDFDRCHLRKPKMAWQQANLQRLLRSFRKIMRGRALGDFEVMFWHPLLAAYHRLLADRYVRGER